MKKKTTGEEDVKPDLKHDTMEFSAATDGDDQLDTDDASYEEDGIDAEELDAIEDDPDSEGEALNAAETDRQADEDNLPDEEWTDDLPDTEEGDQGKEYHTGGGDKIDSAFFVAIKAEWNYFINKSVTRLFFCLDAKKKQKKSRTT